ncbi:zinc finger domain-containing protein [Bacillus sp. V33-4]|uniref:zinc finger domain-containing protein n=1 Tax=Bacillus sp. V33-4 TaxID=2054169 RepID=UPI000C761CE8|nr:zinc finger domain-containing protein [Bacillus sp. V33-4]PLR87102.1 hypothetical protein CVD23_04585 [Bacillus sp. V33-4]
MDHPLFAGDVKTGGYNQLFNVYDRAGEPCTRCGTAIEKGEKAARKSFYCPNCQKVNTAFSRSDAVPAK